MSEELGRAVALASVCALGGSKNSLSKEEVEYLKPRLGVSKGPSVFFRLSPFSDCIFVLPLCLSLSFAALGQHPLLFRLSLLLPLSGHRSALSSPLSSLPPLPSFSLRSHGTPSFSSSSLHPSTVLSFPLSSFPLRLSPFLSSSPPPKTHSLSFFCRLHALAFRSAP